MEFTVDTYWDNYDNALNDLKVINMNTGEEVEKEFYWFMVRRLEKKLFDTPNYMIVLMVK